MPVLDVKILSKCSKEQKKNLIEELGKATYELLHIPAEKIVVTAKEYETFEWGRAGVVADDNDFFDKSRRKTI